MKNYEIGRLAEGVLRGAKIIIVFERERSVLKTVVVFEREQLYRPSGDPFWPFWQKASSELFGVLNRNKPNTEAKVLDFKSPAKGFGN